MGIKEKHCFNLYIHSVCRVVLCCVVLCCVVLCCVVLCCVVLCCVVLLVHTVHVSCNAFTLSLSKYN